MNNIPSIGLPRLYCPLPSKINRFVHQSSIQTRDWVEKFRLHTGEDFKKYENDRLTWMTARFYPTADRERFILSDKFNTLLFAMDDSMDHQDDKSDMIKSRQNFEQFIATCLAIMKDEIRFTGNAHLDAMVDLWVQMKEISTVEWQQKFIVSIGKMFDSALWGFDNFAIGRIPSVAEFYKKRPFLGAAHISTDMITIIENIDLPDGVLQNPMVTEITKLARNAVCWANDLFSLSKELAHEDQHNMVLIVQHEQKVDLTEAIRQTVLIHNKDMRRYIKLIRDLPSFGFYDVPLRRYVDTLSAILRGNIDWSINETGRYYDFEYMGWELEERTAVLHA